MHVRRVRQRDVFEPNEPTAADLDDPHRSHAVVDRVDVAKLA